MPLPNLFVIGAPKCGTTSLHRYLDQHPRISMAAVKEPKFFLATGRARPPRSRRTSAPIGPTSSIAAYERLFTYPPGPGRTRGVLSLLSVATRRRPGIRELVPDARLVAILREPTLRAYSNWADLREQGREKLDFASAMAAEQEREQLDWEPFWFYRQLGLYGEQLARLFTVFPREQVWVLLADDLAAAPDRAVGEVFAFLGLEPLGRPLEDERLNQTMYRPVDRKSRILETLLERGQRARAGGPAPGPPGRPDSCAGDCAPRRRAVPRLASAARVRRDLAADRQVLEHLGIDVSRWDSSGSEDGHSLHQI